MSAPGTTFGRYVIRTRLGAGGMGEVYLADDTQLGRRVALKFLLPAVESDPIAQRRFLREARAAATLDHPHICSVYEVGEADGRPFIAMQYVEGEALDARVRRAPLTLRETLTLAVQIVDALTEAHGHGLLHRDIKPANIMVNARGDAKVMDFGLAKAIADAEETAGTASLLSARGEIIGTAPYMSPEQARGEVLDARSDLFSVGVLLYELVSGQRPFQGHSSAAVAAAILTQEPHPLARFSAHVPPELERIVAKLLRKQPDNRYQTAKDLLIDLRTLKDEQDFHSRLGETPPTGRATASAPAASTPASAPGTVAPASAPAMDAAASGAEGPPGTVAAGSRPRRPALIAAAAIAAIAIGAGGWYAVRASNARWARAQVAEVAALAEARRYHDAYGLATEVLSYVPGDPTIAALMPAISDTISVTTDPPGAAVHVRRFTGVPDDAGAPRQLLGSSPLTNVRLARGEYVLSIEKDGYAPIERTISGALIRVGEFTLTPPPIRISQKLLPADAMPPRMAFVPGSDYRLVSWSRPTDRRVNLDDFFIDKFEVSNREFKEFINAGGYVKREFWRHPFVRDGKTIPWADAMRLFVDRTGLSAPRTWSNQSVPDGKADHPVTDVTWYEADAYAAFRGMRLPSIFQWEKAARDGFTPQAGVAGMPWGPFHPGDPLDNRANFAAAALPTTSNEFGMSVYGAYNMAGNVAEWTANDSSEGFLATGGAWGDPTYTFAQFGGRPGFFSSDKLGFRCVRDASQTSGDQGRFKLEMAREVPQYTRSTPAELATLAAAYRYDTTAPLEARIEETIDTPEWRREKITFAGANGARAIAYLYLPNNAPRPLQVIQYLPAGDVDGGFRSLPASLEDRVGPFVRAGRAAFGVVLEGYIERLRPPSYVRPSATTVEFADQVIGRVTDLRRGLDYLETRSDVDRTKIAALAPSAGSLLGMIVGAVEPRYRTFAFVGAGLPASYRPIVAAANPINFVPHIAVPKLIVQGRYDEDTPLRTAAEPFFALLPEPKKMVLYDGGHVPPLDVLMAAASGWLDETMGRVIR